MLEHPANYWDLHYGEDASKVIGFENRDVSDPLRGQQVHSAYVRGHIQV